MNINALKLTGEQKFGRNGNNYGSYGFVNHLQSAVNGTDGVMITSGKDTNISGSQVASLGNVNINAQNINITNVVNSESIESKRVNSGFISTETKTKSGYIERQSRLPDLWKQCGAGLQERYKRHRLRYNGK